MKPNIKELTEYFKIDLEKRGLVFVKDSGQGGRYEAGTRAGATQLSGHRIVCFKGKYYPESNVAWALYYGEWPEGKLSNLNGDLQDNRPQNLYICARKENVKRLEKDITFERINFLFSYEKNTGVLIWNVNKPPNVKKGYVAGFYSTTGYLKVAVDGVVLRIHRIVWMLHNKRWPLKYIDHINGIRDDNRLENLREANKAQNCQNVFLKSNNTSGFKGVRFRKDTKKYSASIQINKKVISLGCFDKIEDAIKARKEAERIHHPFRKII